MTDGVPLREVLEKEVQHLKELVERIFDERQRAIDAALVSQKEALAQASAALADYKTSSNEFRGTLSDQAKTLLTRTEAEARFKQLEVQLADLQSFKNRGEGVQTASAASKSNNQWTIALIVTIALAAFGFIATYIATHK